MLKRWRRERRAAKLARFLVALDDAAYDAHPLRPRPARRISLGV